MSVPPEGAEWPGYLAAFHAERAGITEAVLERAIGLDSCSPYDWLVDGIPLDATVLDLACGSAPLAARLSGRLHIGADLSEPELTLAAARGVSVTVAQAQALPLPKESVDVVVCSMALMLMQPVDGVLTEVARVLRPGGRLIALVPTDRPRSIGDLRTWLGLVLRLRSALRYPEALAELGERLRRAGLRLDSDVRRRFPLPVRDETDAAELVRSLYLPGVPTDRTRRAGRWLARRSPLELGVPLRRISAVRE